jgi:hypothetical protein
LIFSLPTNKHLFIDSIPNCTMSSTQYRIEASKTGRAGCTEGVCNKEQIKIEKGELRLGTWVIIRDHGGWKWRHWGCVSGHIIQSIRESADGEDGTYDWDLVDGYDELSSDLQDKFRRVIEQGFIDPEDFKGDPECNALGNRGIRLTAAQKRKKEEVAAEGDATPKEKKRAEEEEGSSSSSGALNGWCD